MFLVKDRRLGIDQYVFTHTDPRGDGYKGEVFEGVKLDYDMNAIHLWSDGELRPDPQLGRDPNNTNHYKVFKYPEDLRQAGFELVHFNTPLVAYSWSDYRKQYYPVPEQYAKSMTQDEWFEFLEEADLATKLRKKMNQSDEPMKNGDPKQIAEWVAKRHMGADGGIQQVWFLPTGSPSNEIRLLEVSELFTGEAANIEPVDFGLDIEGAKYRLKVADISLDQLGKIKSDPAKRLPEGWQMEGASIWNRRGRQQ